MKLELVLVSAFLVALAVIVHYSTAIPTCTLTITRVNTTEELKMLRDSAGYVHVYGTLSGSVTLPSTFQSFGEAEVMLKGKGHLLISTMLVAGKGGVELKIHDIQSNFYWTGPEKCSADVLMSLPSPSLSL